MKNKSKNIGLKTPLRPRQRVLVPKAISQAQQSLAGNPAELNANFFMTPAQPRRGAPFGNQNALRHGRRTREMQAFRAEVRAHVRESWRLIAALKKMLREVAGDIPVCASDRADA